MSEKIYITDGIKNAFDATSSVVEELGLYASASLGHVTPKGYYPRRVFANAVRNLTEGILSVTVTYSLENIPAHGRWSFTFVFSNNCSNGAVSITRITNNDINMKSCDFSVDAVKNAVIELGK